MRHWSLLTCDDPARSSTATPGESTIAEITSAPLRIELIGPFRVLDAHGDAIELPRGKPTALLACVAAHPRGLPREDVEAMFWPQSDAHARRHSFRQAHSTLRKRLGIDPMKVGERVEIDVDVCSLDLDVLHRPAGEVTLDDIEAVVRGLPYAGLPPVESTGFQRWRDHAVLEAHQRLGVLIEDHARRCLDDEDEASSTRWIAAGVRAGLTEASLRLAVWGTRIIGIPWASARLGTDGLCRATAGHPKDHLTVVLVVEDQPGWVESTIAHCASTPDHPVRQSVISLSAGVGPNLPRALIRTLIALPGGAAVTDRTSDYANAAPAQKLESELEQRDAVRALADAFEAVLHEQPIILTLPVNGLASTSASLLARAISLCTEGGLTLVLTGESERQFETAETRSLLNLGHALRCVRQDARVMPEQSPTPPARERVPRSSGRVRAAVAAVLALVAIVSWAVWPAEATVSTAYDVIFCSDRSGAPQYFRWSSHSGVTERVTADTAVATYGLPSELRCRPYIGMGAGPDSIVLASRSGEDIRWSAYDARFGRGDAVGRVLLSGLEDPGMLVESIPNVVVFPDGTGSWSLVRFSAPSRPERRSINPATAPSDNEGPWFLMELRDASGNADLFRAYVETGQLERLTDSPLDEVHGTLRRDSLLFSRGRTGDDEDGSLDLYLLHRATGVEERLTDNDWNDYEVRWSADGRHICWQSERLGHYQSEIMVMDLRTRREWNLSDEAGRDYGCRFTPDGSNVVYHTLRTGDVELMIEPVRGGQVVNISAHPMSDQLTGFVRR